MYKIVRVINRSTSHNHEYFFFVLNYKNILQEDENRYPLFQARNSRIYVF